MPLENFETFKKRITSQQPQRYGGITSQGRLPSFSQFKSDIIGGKTKISPESLVQTQEPIQVQEQVIESPTSGEINVARGSFWAPSPKGVTLRDVIRELPGAFKDTASEIKKSIIRSGVVAETAFKGIFEGKNPLTVEFKPETDYQKQLFGTDKPISFESVGNELLSVFGKDEETAGKASKWAIPLGMFFVGLDLTPIGTGAKLAVKEAALQIAKTTSKKQITSILKKTLTGSRKEIKSMAEALTPIKNQNMIERALTSATRQDVRITKHITAKPIDDTSVVINKYKTADDFADNSISIRRADPSNVAPEDASLRTLANKITRESDEYQKLVKQRNDIILQERPNYKTTVRLIDRRAEQMEDDLFKQFYKKNIKKVVPEIKAGKGIAEVGIKKVKELPTKPLGMREIIMKDIIKAKEESTKTLIRKTTGQVKPKSLIAFNERMEQLAKASIKGARTAEKRIKEAQKEAVSIIRENLPIEQRGKFMGVVTDIRDLKDLPNASKLIQEAIEENIVKAAMKLARGETKKKVSFLRKLAELNQTAISEVKAKVGLTGSIHKADVHQLEDILKELKKRYAYKRKKGFVSEINKKTKKPKTMTKDMLALNREVQKQAGKGVLGRKMKTYTESVGKYFDKYLAPISTRLENIHPSLKTALRRYEFKSKLAILKDARKIKPWLKKARPTRKIKGEKGLTTRGGGIMSTDDYLDLDLAMKNGDARNINKIVKKYKLGKEYKVYKKTLDDLYERAQKVGFDAGYEKNYSPRILIDGDGLLEYLQASKGWSKLETGLLRKEFELGRALTKAERVSVMNTFTRGYSNKQIPIVKTGFMKNRVIDFIDPQMNKFYAKTNDALTKYITFVNDQIEMRRFFGKSGIGIKKKIKGKRGQQVTSKKGEFLKADAQDSVGAYVEKLLREDKISLKDADELKEILSARFNEKGTSGIIGLYKNLTYMDVMGSPYNAITQVGDLTFSIYAGGLARTLKQIPLSLIRKAKLKKADIGIDRIAIEFSDTSWSARAVDFVFRASGLTGIDALGKEALLNSTLSKFQQLARLSVKKQGKQYRKLRTKLDNIFGNEADKVLKDLKNDNITQDVKFLMFNEILDFQPLAMSEVPQKYLSSGNGRIFYMLKTWSLKMIDVYRREVFRTIKRGYQTGDKKMISEGIGNMIKLSGAMMASEITADSLKDLLLGRPINLKDTTIDNFLRLGMLNRYSLTRAREEGIGTVLRGVFAPPTQAIDDVYRDVRNVLMDPDESFEINNLRSVQDIPLGGKLYYWWIGRAAKYKDTLKKTKAKKTETSTRSKSTRSKSTNTRSKSQ